MLHRILLALVAAMALVSFSPAARAQEDVFESPITKADIDLPNCQTLMNGKPVQVDSEEILAALGIAKQQGHGWTAGRAQGKTVFQYVLAFKTPVSVGSMLFTTRQVSILKADAPWPPDPAKEDSWTAVAVLPNQGHVKLAALAAVTATRALLFTDTTGWGNSTLGPVRIFKKRLHNVIPDGFAQADSEYIAYSDLGPPNMHLAAHIVKGTGNWENCGVDEKKIMHRAPISDLAPSWFCVSWDKPQSVAGLFIEDNFQDVKIQTFAGPAGISPPAGIETEWANIKDATQKVSQGRWVSMPARKTNGLRLFILKAGGGPVAQIDAMLAVTDLGDAAVPQYAPEQAAAAPCSIPYSLEQDGQVTMAVDDANGIRMRNIVARVERTKGANAENWDLKDESGHPVPAGTYTWKAITHPPLVLKYEMTPYPNVIDNAPQNSPWLNGASGPGGWLADHTAPDAVAASGDCVYMGAACAESGVGFIACDATGAKKWGIGSFAAWTGAKRIAADGNNVFVEGGNAFASENMDRVWQVDIDNQSYSDAVMHSGDETRAAGATGIAAGGGKLYLCIQARSNWLCNATGASTVDIENCIPRQKKMKPTGLKAEPDPRTDFLRLFRLTGTPPGYNGLIWLESTLGPERQQNIVLAFNKAVNVGSLAVPLPDLKDAKVKFSILKAGAPYPPNPDDAASWEFFEKPGHAGWNVLAAPPGASTRAVRISFIKGADDALADAMDKKDDDGELKLDKKGKDKDKDKSMAGSGAWSGKLEGVKLMRRRFEDVPPDHVATSSGEIDAEGTWDAKRSEALSEADPGIYMMEWKQATTLRGLAIKEIDGKRTEIDAFTGPDDAKIDLAAQGNWENVASYEQKLRSHYQGSQSCNAAARYMDGYVDFGREIKTRAVRLRVVEQYTSSGHYPEGVRADLGGTKLEPNRCRIFGVAAVKLLGGEPPVDPLVDQRVEVYDQSSKKLLKEVHLPKGSGLALNPAGDLYAISAGKIVKVDIEKGEHKDFVTDLVKPTCLAFDAHGALYVFDNDPNRQVIRVYGADGKYQRDIGTPGGYVEGPWDGMRFRNVVSLAADKSDHLWVAEECYWPKRVSQWKIDGTLLKQFYGPTQYGGGGVLDPWDKSRLFFGPLEFELDWATGKTRLKNLTYAGNGWEAGELPIKVGDRTYLVNRATDARSGVPTGIVYLYEKDRARPVAAVGAANSFSLLKTPEIMKVIGTKPLTALQFIWADKNGDGKVQADEVTFFEKPVAALTGFNRDLGTQGGEYRYVVKEFLANGAPQYELKENPKLATQGKGFANALYRMDNGNVFRMGGSASEACFNPDGQMLWSYASEGVGTHALSKAKPYQPGQLVCEFGWIGEEKAPVGDLGDFVVIHTNVGAWNVWTADGLLAASIFRDIRDPKRKPWSMLEHPRGMILEDVTPGQEHFQGYFCRTVADNKYYILAGHNHASVVEVEGMDKFKRLGGQIVVEANMLRQASAFEQLQARRRAQMDVKVIDCYTRGRDIKIDGDLEDWDAVEKVQLYSDDYRKMNSIPSNASFAMTYDDENLYVMFETSDMGPLKNSGNQWDKLFKTGGAVDLQMGLDGNAAGDRKSPVQGDFRLLMTYMNGKPIAVVYRSVVPGTPEDKVQHIVSPVFDLRFDQIAQVPEVKMAVGKSERGNGYAFEAAIPLKTLGLTIVPGTRLKMDWGMLTTDENGTVVLSRTYWSNKATSILADAPSEAVLNPDLWGYVRFYGKSTKGFNISDPSKFLSNDKDKDKKGTDSLKLEDE